MTKKRAGAGIEWRNIKVKLGWLQPWGHNPRQSTKKQASRILESFNAFGQVQTVAVGPAFDVYDGHQRLSALLTLHGADYEIDARQSSRALTDDERRRLVIALHAGAQGAWDWDALGGWDETLLASAGMDAELLEQMNRDAIALREMLSASDAANASDADAEPQMDKADELRKKWGVQRGQAWQLGEHRLMCGDSTSAEDVARLMRGEKADAVVTDPPYGQNQLGVPHDSPEELRGILSGCLAVMPITNAVVISFASPRTFPEWLDQTRAHGHKFERMLWLYKAAQMAKPWRGWILKSESILATSVGKPTWNEVKPYAHDCYYKSEVSGQLPKDSGWHGSIKPLDVVKDLTQRICETGAIVYDPFSGSGTTIIACEQLGRKCRAMEIAPEYVAVALQRWADATGKAPALIDTLDT